MARSTNRKLKKYKERSLETLDKHVAMLEAAYCKATDIAPKDVCLVHHVTKGEDESLATRYWFEPLKKTDLGDCHPSVQYMFEIAVAVTKAGDRRKELEIIDDLKRHIRENYLEDEEKPNESDSVRSKV